MKDERNVAAPVVERQPDDPNSEWEDTFGPDYEDDSEPLEVVAIISTEQKELGHYFTPDQLRRFNRIYRKAPATSYTIELVRLEDATSLQAEVAALQSTIAQLQAHIAELERIAKDFLRLAETPSDLPLGFGADLLNRIRACLDATAALNGERK